MFTGMRKLRLPHTGASLYPEPLALNRLSWIPAFAGMTSLWFSLSPNNPRVANLT